MTTVYLESDIWACKRVPAIDLLAAAGFSRSEARRLVRGGTREILMDEPLTEGLLVLFEPNPLTPPNICLLLIGKTLRVEVKQRPLDVFERLRLWLVQHVRWLDREELLPSIGNGVFERCDMSYTDWRAG